MLLVKLVRNLQMCILAVCHSFLRTIFFTRRLYAICIFPGRNCTRGRNNYIEWLQSQITFQTANYTMEEIIFYSRCIILYTKNKNNSVFSSAVILYKWKVSIV